jgi:C1A family cysteine protease
MYKKLGNSNSLPISVDWRTVGGGKVTSVKDQGSCGSCWTFTTAGVYESLLLIGGRPNPIDLSEEYVLECTTRNSPPGATSDCKGGLLNYAMKMAA